MGVLALALLAGCSEPPAVEGWTPPGWDDHAGVRLAASDTDTAAALNDLGFIRMRIRNDAAGYQARYVQIAGAGEFNKRVDAMIRAPLAQLPFTPEAFPSGSGLADRGCLPGSAGWDADRVLTDPATGPANATGTAITCEVIAAFGSIVGVTMRTVTGTAGTVTADQKTTLYADVAGGTVTDAAAFWKPDAASDVWTRTVEQLRRQAGGLSSAPIAPPSDEQTALAAQALADVRERDDGTATITLPPGIASPELAGLGLDQTTAATSIEADSDLLAGWQTDAAAALENQRNTPFAGLPAWNASLPVDCSLHTCVAVTYDDGPGPYTKDLLKTLLAAQAGATFFMQGKNITGNTDIVRAVAADGHDIGSHTMTHPDLTKVGPDKDRAEVVGCADLIAGITGEPVTFFRPPYGAVNDAVLAAIGKPAILWSIDTNDWQGPGRAALIQRSVPVSKPGDIILFHDTHRDSVTAASDVMAGLQDRGFTPVTLTQLFGGKIPPGKVIRR